MKYIQTTMLVTEQQMKKLKKRSEATGNSRNSLVRTAINEYFLRRGHERLGD